MSSRILVIGCFALAAAALARAQEECPGFQASLTPEHALYPNTQRIEGVTLSIWGENPQSALSIGLVNGSSQASSGFSIGLVNYAESYGGVHWSLANFTEGSFGGWQGGPLFGLLGSVVNYAGGDMTGLQTGVINLSGKLSGLQVGLVNYTQFAESGVQIGVINLISENSGWFTNLPQEVAPGMVLVNWRF